MNKLDTLSDFKCIQFINVGPKIKRGFLLKQPPGMRKKNPWSNYLHLQLFNSNHLVSCTSTYNVLPLYKVLLIFIELLRRSCAYKVYGQTDRVIQLFPPLPSFTCVG